MNSFGTQRALSDDDIARITAEEKLRVKVRSQQWLKGLFLVGACFVGAPLLLLILIAIGSGLFGSKTPVEEQNSYKTESGKPHRNQRGKDYHPLLGHNPRPRREDPRRRQAMGGR